MTNGLQDGEGVQFTAGGFRRLQNGAPAGEVIPFEVKGPPAAESEFASPARVAQAQSAPTPEKSTKRAPKLSPKNVVGAAKQRIREIRAELKNHAKLQTELEQLERLVAAANEKPSNVRTIKRAG